MTKAKTKQEIDEEMDEALGRKATPTEQALMDAMPEMMWRAFNNTLQQCVKAGIIDLNRSAREIAEQLDKRAVMYGCYLGMLRIMSLDGKEDVMQAHGVLNLILKDFIDNLAIGDCPDCEDKHLMCKEHGVEEKPTHPQANAPTTSTKQ